MTKSIEKRGATSLLRSSTASGQVGKSLVFGSAFAGGALIVAGLLPFIAFWHVIIVAGVLGLLMWER